MVGDCLPQGLAQPPMGLVAPHVEFLAADGIGEVIVDDAVVGGVESGDDGVVIGEG